MDSSVLVAIITSSLGLVGTICTVFFGQKKTRDDTSMQLTKQNLTISSQLEQQQRDIMSQLEQHNAVQDERIRTLSDRVDAHNRVIERTYKLEGRVDCLSRRVTDLSVRTGGSGEDC